MLGMSKVICFKQGFYSSMRSSEKFLEFAMILWRTDGFAAMCIQKGGEDISLTRFRHLPVGGGGGFLM